MNVAEGAVTVGERLVSLLSHLGLNRVHVGTAPPADLLALHAASPDSIGAIVFMNPPRLTQATLAEFRDRVAVFTGDQGPTAQALASVLNAAVGVESHVAPGSESALWTDYVAEQADWIGPTLLDFLIRQNEAHPATHLSGHADGTFAGITYRIRGQGPALVLLPASLAPSQWDPLIDQLSTRFAVITLTGAQLGYPALLENRANDPSCRRILRALFDEMKTQREDRMLEIGCGTGVFLRWLAEQEMFAPPLTGVDLNPYFLREAAALADQTGFADRLTFVPGNVEALPFEDASFDVALSFTLLEECDADKALAEIHRVLRPNGRVAVVVRATDIPLYWHLPVSADIARKVNVVNPLVGPAGCADASISRRLRKAGFNVTHYWPSFCGTADVAGPYWTIYRHNLATPHLAPEDLVAWDTAHDGAAREGDAFMGQPVHCAVGTKGTHE